MASVKDTASFFVHGNSKQFDFVLNLYPKVLKLKAEKKTKKPDELIRLDEWYQNELPKRIKQRGKDAHLVHEELVQAMKWKQTRGKFYPQLSYLIKVNTPRAVMQETKKAFRKLPNLEQALTALSNLKGVGTTMASALLAAAAPDTAPFMADECLMAIPEIEGIDYTTKEYLNFVNHIQTTVNRLNTEKDNHKINNINNITTTNSTTTTTTTTITSNNIKTDKTATTTTTDKKNNTINAEMTTLPITDATTIQQQTSNSLLWSAHRVELAIWTHYVATELQPELLEEMPIGGGLGGGVGRGGLNIDDATIDNDTNDGDVDLHIVTTNGNTTSSLEQSDESNLEPAAPPNGSNGNGIIDSLDESTRSEDSMEKPITLIVVNNNDEITNDSDSQSSAKRSLVDCESSESQTDSSEPEMKKIRNLE